MNGFCTSKPTDKSQATTTHCELVPHIDLCFQDANLAILAGNTYFLVHEGVLRRHSEILGRLVEVLDRSKCLEGRPLLTLEGAPHLTACLLQSLYDGIPPLLSDGTDFAVISGLLRLLTKYKVHRLRSDLLRALTRQWPTKLPQWEAREAGSISAFGLYGYREPRPHPILIIQLAHDIDAPELLPSAFYDLSRSPPSQVLAGYVGALSRHSLSDDDLLNLLRGREYSLRFLSVFVANELEGREPSEWCQYRDEADPNARRTCQVVFEAITAELLRDVNGVMCNRTSDPLYAILKAELMQSRPDISAGDSKAVRRACEVCRAEFGAVVDAVREEFWQKLPIWFGVHVEQWA